MIVPARGPGHFGWDPIFEPLGTGLTYANFTSPYPYYWHDIEIKLCRDAFWTEEQVIASGQGTWKTGTFYRDLGLVHNPSKEKKNTAHTCRFVRRTCIWDVHLHQIGAKLSMMYILWLYQVTMVMVKRIEIQYQWGAKIHSTTHANYKSNGAMSMGWLYGENGYTATKGSLKVRQLTSSMTLFSFRCFLALELCRCGCCGREVPDGVEVETRTSFDGVPEGRARAFIRSRSWIALNSNDFLIFLLMTISGNTSLIFSLCTKEIGLISGSWARWRSVLIEYTRGSGVRQVMWRHAAGGERRLTGWLWLCSNESGSRCVRECRRYRAVRNCIMDPSMDGYIFGHGLRLGSNRGWNKRHWRQEKRSQSKIRKWHCHTFELRRSTTWPLLEPSTTLPSASSRVFLDIPPHDSLILPRNIIIKYQDSKLTNDTYKRLQ